jgi:transcriptional repressor NrdR
MKCPYCGHADTRVTDSRESEDGIRRRRECLSAECGRRFTTYERVQIAPLTIIKKDGRREEFSREKIRSGIRRSCAKLPISAVQIDALVDGIEASLHASGRAEVPSQEVGDMVMERLQDLDHVAYVRFASHYRNFLSLDELKQEFERLAGAPRRTSRRAGAAQPPLLPPTELTRLTEQPNLLGESDQPPQEPSSVTRLPVGEERSRRRGAGGVR